jgi:hypothetical protein
LKKKCRGCLKKNDKGKLTTLNTYQASGHL